jgi:hypothetical protein
MNIISLKHETPIASGSIRDVYRHPFDGGLLIKVVRRSTLDEKFGSGRPWRKFANRRYRHFISYLREIREHLALHAIDERHPPYLQNVAGLAQTDLGLGLVVEAAVDRDGRCAPTLATLIQSQAFDRAAREQFEQFCAALIESRVIIADLHIRNVVYAYAPDHGEHFVLIDGIGFKTLIPLERWSRHINRFTNSRKVRKLQAKVKSLAAEQINSGRSKLRNESVAPDGPSCDRFAPAQVRPR